MKKYLLSLKIVGMIILLVLSGSYTLKTYGEEQIITQGTVVVDSVPSESTDTSTESTTVLSDSKEIMSKTETCRETEDKSEKKNGILANNDQLNQSSYPKTGESVFQTLFISGIGVLLLISCFSYIVYIRKKRISNSVFQ